jgi:hypothetical protein
MTTLTMLNVPRLKLRERLGELLPRPLQKSLFLGSRSEDRQHGGAGGRGHAP